MLQAFSLIHRRASVKLKSVFALLLISLAGLLIQPGRVTGSSAARPPAQGNPTMPALAGEKALDYLKQQGSYDSLQAFASSFQGRSQEYCYEQKRIKV